MLKNETFEEYSFAFINFFYIFASKINISLKFFKVIIYLLIKIKFIIMIDKKINGAAPQDGEEQKLYENLRNWDDEIINQKMEDLGIPNVKLTSKRKYILGMIDTLADINTKKFFLRNSDFMEIAKISKTPFVETIKYFSKLGIIKRESGVRGKASQYKFNEKNLKKLPMKNQTLIEKTDQTLNVVSASVPSVSSEYSLVKGSGEKQSVENRPPQSQPHSQLHPQLQLQQNSYSHSQLHQQLQPNSYSQLQEHEQEQNSLVMNNIDNTLMEELLNKVNELYEKVDSIYNLINDDRRVQSEVNRKLLEGIKKLHSSISSSRNSNETVSSITSNNKEVQASVNKETTVTTNCKERDTSSTTSTLDKIMSFQVKSIEEQEQQTRKLQEASNQTSESNTKTRVQENNSNDGERNYVLKKLECEIIKPYKITFMNTNSYDKLIEAKENFYKSVDNLWKVHKDVITSSDIKHFANELRTLFQQKEEELQQAVNNNEPSSNVNYIVKSEENNTKDSEQKHSKDETVDATDVETSPKEDETDNTRFQHIDKTSTDSENCQEKETATAEQNAVESKKVQVSETDTPNCEEKSKEQIVEEFEKETSTMFLIDDSKNTVQAKQVEEVQFPKTEKIVLNEEEKRQLQELVDNTTINKMLESYSALDGDKHEVILTEIRKAVTRCKYKEKLVQAYIDYIWDIYRSFDCTVQEAMKPIEINNEDAVTATTSTPEGDDFEKFKKSLDNIENNVKECGDNLPFGKNPKSRYQEDEEATVEESNSDEPTDEEIAMAATSPYDETKDAIF